MANSGYRSPFGFWIGGISAPVYTTRAGYRSLLGFWLGGISAPKYVPPPIPPLHPSPVYGIIWIIEVVRVAGAIYFKEGTINVGEILSAETLPPSSYPALTRLHFASVYRPVRDVTAPLWEIAQAMRYD